ncbi:hypothetical protein GJ688_18170 [Heliobacillus mobilis]|uniref:Uncharacterized protein n=1 Tax=Heliobacterium mobile TaxID=28064 RepID=A0A6I3SP80_HELMO|nr:hypothetical protein [Heliobacterium mobile]MTV50860.1 hypothetical protein [Heliobacterium mobile]
MTRKGKVSFSFVLLFLTGILVVSIAQDYAGTSNIPEFKPQNNAGNQQVELPAQGPSIHNYIGGIEEPKMQYAKPSNNGYMQFAYPLPPYGNSSITPKISPLDDALENKAED